MEPLKEMFNRAFYQKFALAFSNADRAFDPAAFVREVTDDLASLSLNGRLRNTSVILKKHLPVDFKKALSVMYAAAPGLPHGYTALVLPDFVALYGKDHFGASMEALKFFTGMGSSEFAVREFLKKDMVRTLKVMHKWSMDKDHHVRRLASEGSRPRLPWSFKLEEVIKDPSLTQDILEQLKADESLYVRKSVANHLNDHSRDNPAYMLKLIGKWDMGNRHTAWIIKHASRTLIKKGDPAVLKLFGFHQAADIRLKKLTASKKAIQLGDTLLFGFELHNGGNKPRKLVVDYSIHYVKSKGVHSQKVFKLKEITLPPGKSVEIKKQQMFRDLTTRKHFGGKHILEILVNGQVAGRLDFLLTV